MKALTPLGRRILVKRDPVPEMAGSFFLPDQAKEKSNYATVLATGLGVDDEGKDVTEQFNVKTGDKILIPQYNPRELVVGEEGEFLMNEREVLGLCQEEANV